MLTGAAYAAGVVLEPWHVTEAPAPDLDGVAGLVVLGGAVDVDQADGLPWMRDELALLGRALDIGIPVLGLCLGSQMLARALGGEVRRLAVPEIGWHPITMTAAADRDPLLTGLGEPELTVFQWHHCAFDAPPKSTMLAANAVGCQAFRQGSAWGLQFHPEVTAEILEHWFADEGDGEEARSAGVDAAGLRAETEQRITASMRLGATLMQRFAGAAQTLW